MFALRPATTASRRRILCLQTANASNSATTSSQGATMFDFANAQQQKPQAFPVDDPPPTGRGHPKPASFLNPLHRSPLRYRLHCRASRNNTVVQVTEPNGRSLAWFSGASLKVKGVTRASYEAGYQCAVAAFQVIKQVLREKGDIQLELYFKGFGQGREAMKTALLAVEGTEVRRLVSLLQDRTPIKIGGTRAPKARRL